MTAPFVRCSAPEHIPTQPGTVALLASHQTARLEQGDDSHTKKRPSRSEFVATQEEAEAFFEKMRQSTETGANPLITLKEYVDSIGDRWQRGLDPTSTLDGYDAGHRLCVLPALGHLKVSRISTGLIDRTIDRWETEYGPSTVKNSIAPVVRVLDVAVRDEVIP